LGIIKPYDKPGEMGKTWGNPDGAPGGVKDLAFCLVLGADADGVYPNG
jgi:hypothetical protein